MNSSDSQAFSYTYMCPYYTVFKAVHNVTIQI